MFTLPDILLAKQKKFDRVKIGELLGPPLETAGMIILITSAGGAFGSMIEMRESAERWKSFPTALA